MQNKIETMLENMMVQVADLKVAKDLVIARSRVVLREYQSSTSDARCDALLEQYDDLNTARGQLQNSISTLENAISFLKQVDTTLLAKVGQ